ncbi:hypothetical protein R2927_004437 [Salmonella enterica]|uniref:hypothetical protein n=1 Tax=Salmonella enterica TaxID=28901 RepID=UPI00129A12FB|nr:hypothetical protein [Salmonella enterica]EAX8328953.1 hypothetical protein [Salmonella enterica]EIS6182947.1 hypothetical protein [Salmonella enterica]EJW7250408.1 hypothetical protein [Salmonella enterica]EKA6293953.1 hypothetical protein [Salmonella enterica]ELQ8529915.1 hypothetical protein [Salmonella enterica]
MTPEIKKRILILLIFVARILVRSLRDVPFVLLVGIFAFLLLAPDSVWITASQVWHQIRPLTDHEAVMLGRNISNLLQLAWVIAAGGHFILSLNEIDSRMKEVKNDR